MNNDYQLCDFCYTVRNFEYGELLSLRCGLEFRGPLLFSACRGCLPQVQNALEIDPENVKLFKRSRNIDYSDIQFYPTQEFLDLLKEGHAKIKKNLEVMAGQIKILRKLSNKRKKEVTENKRNEKKKKNTQ